MLLRIILISCCFINFVSYNYAQELFSVNYSHNSPLQTQSIYNIYFASNNLLYIGTNNGLWSYNGIEFKQYTTLLSQNSPMDVTNIQEDAEHTIYMQNFRGQVFYIKDNHLLLDTIAQSITEKIETYTIKGDFIYYASYNNIHIYNKKTKQLKLLNESDSILNHWEKLTLNGFVTHLSNDIYLTGQSKLYQLDEDTLVNIKTPENQFYNYMELNGELFFSIPQNGFYSIRDKNDRLLIDLSKYETKLTPYQIQRIQGELFVGCQEGLYIPKTNQVYLKGKYITEILTDNEQNIWCSTLDGGLFKLNFKTLVYPINNEIKTVDYIFADKNKLIISDKNAGLYNWSATSTEFQCFYKISEKSEVETIFFSPYSNCYWVNSNNSYVFDSTLNSTQVISSYGAIGLQQKVLHKIRDKYSIVYSDELLFYQTTNQKEALKSSEKFTAFKINTNKNIIFLNAKLKVEGLNKWRTTILAVISDTLTYIHIDNNQYQIQSILPLPKFEKSYVKNDRLFILTDTQFVEFDRVGNIIGRIERVNGLEYKKITNLSIDHRHIAISTKQGIYLLDAHSFKLLHQFTAQNGIASTDFSKGWLYNDHLYVNGSSGVSCIELDGHYNKGAPSLSINQVLVNDSLRIDNSFAFNENSIALHLNVHSYTAGGTIRWRLNEKAWKNLQGEPIISLDKLQYGRYTINVFFENDLGTSSQTINYHFEIDKPYWLKGWFWLIIVSILSGILFLIYKRRISRIEEQNRLKNHLIASQMTALKSQMNPHFIFNALNSIQSLVKFKKNKEAYKYINKFAILLRETLNYSDKDFIPLERELSMLKNYLDMETMRFDGALNFEIKVNCSTDIQIPSMIIQPFVENAVKHGLLHKTTGQKQLSLDFVLKEDKLLICTVTDNGIGRKKAQEIKQHQQGAASFSTHATKKRLELLQELYQNELGVSYIDLQDALGNPIGTKVVLIIPIDE